MGRDATWRHTLRSHAEYLHLKGGRLPSIFKIQLQRMKSLVFTEYKAPLSYQNSTKPIAKDGQKLVKMQAAAFNRRDFWITLGLYPGIIPNCILGSDGVGEVDGI